MIDHKKELEDFVYIISHDLSAPVRHIREFSNILNTNLDGHLNDEGKECLEFIEISVDKTEKILTALTDYSRLNTTEQALTNFDSQEMVEYVVRAFKDRVKEKNATITVSDLPTDMRGDETQLIKLFHVLIDNALKFSSEDKTPQINISAKDQDDYWLFSMKDNGIGIAKEYHGDVFKILKRLNPHQYTSGIGAGLTIAKKIVHLHEGEIWIESDLGKGTTVFFTIKKN